nr:hypothetical protein [Streptomyces sp. SID5468]
MADATGRVPEITASAEAIRIEVTLPGEITPETLSPIRKTLGVADRFGHSLTRAGSIVWAEITRHP